MSNSEAEDEFLWSRVWVRAGEGATTSKGLFSPSLQELGTFSIARRLEDLGNVRALLLRGAMAAGKSTAMAQEARRLRALGMPVVEIDLADADGFEQLAEIAHIPDFSIFLDGADIAIRRSGWPGSLGWSLKKIAATKTSNVRIALRTGFSIDYPLKSLASLFGTEAYDELEIMPLSESDIGHAAEVSGIEPEEFLAAIDVLNLGPLAGQPPTLRMLIRSRMELGRLPSGRHQAYVEGCRALLTESNRERLAAGGGDDPNFAGRLSVGERLQATAGVAAMMVFGDFESLDFSLGASPGALAADKACGESARDRDNVMISRRDLREIVRTGIFRSEGAERFAFCHPSIMQFLAAYFLEIHDLGPARGLSLLTLPGGRVAANRIDVASWIGSLHIGYRAHFIEHDPQTLLRVGIPLPSEHERLLLAQALIDEKGKGLMDLREFAAEDFLLLHNPSLAELLAKTICDHGRMLGVREFACRLAYNADAVPVEACLSIAKSQHEPSALRRAALFALRRASSAREDLVQLAGGPASTIEEYEIQSLALQLCIDERYISSVEAIAKLRCGPAPNGDEKNVCLLILRKLELGELPAALDAVCAVVKRCPQDSNQKDQLTFLAQALGMCGFAQLDNAEVLAAMARLIDAIPHGDPWVRWSFPLYKRGMPPVATEDKRRALVVEAVRLARSSRSARGLLEIKSLLHQDDLIWVARNATTSGKDPDVAIWCTLAVEMIIGMGAVPHRYLLNNGFTPGEIDLIAAHSIEMPPDYEPWSPTLETEIDEERGPEDDDDRQESLLHILSDLRLTHMRREAGGRENVAAISPDDLRSLIASSDRRLIKDSTDLLAVVREAIDRLAHRLRGRSALVRSFWNEVSEGKAIPKTENFMSDFIADHLRTDLAERGIAVNREVEVRPRVADTPGERSDIQVEAFALETSHRKRVAGLTIEVKGCWNKELFSAMDAQLSNRYLASTGHSVGIYLVGWYVCSSWKDPIVAGKAVSGLVSAELKERLTTQAIALSTRTNVKIDAVVLDLSLR